MKFYSKLLVGLSVFTWIIFCYCLYVIYKTTVSQTYSLSNFIRDISVNFYTSIPCQVYLLIFVLISVWLYFAWRGYNLNFKFYGIACVFFAYGACVLLASSLIMLSFPIPENTYSIVNVTTTTNLDFSYLNSSSPFNVTHISSYHFTNITEDNEGSKLPLNSSLQNEAVKKLNSGLFGNAIGLFGIALTLFALTISNVERIHTLMIEGENQIRLQKREYLLKNFKGALTPDQVITLGKIWMVSTILIGFILTVNFTLITIMPYLLAVSFFVSGFFIEIIGILFFLFGYWKSRQLEQLPESLTFEELVQKINDESILKKN